METKFNEPTIWEVRESFKSVANSLLARAVHPLMTWCAYDRHQAHTWALRLIKANPATGEDAAAALTNFDYMIDGAKAKYVSSPREHDRYDAVLAAFKAWKAKNPEQAALAA